MPILDAHTMEFFSRGPEQTRRLGLRLGALMKPGDLVCLTGDLGSGKTTLVQGMAKGWGSLDAVSSPTFIIVNQYRRPDGNIMHHLDAYRLENMADAEDLDLTQMFENGCLVVEWPERIRGALPSDYLRIAMRWVDDLQRGLIFSPQGRRYELMLAEFRRQVLGG
jgi:tRNA threonylcarbamoyladenosine biosynthesis protein TsaE